MIYAYIDGDDVGLRIEKAFMDNNEDSLNEINHLVSSRINLIVEYLKMNDCMIIFNAADGIIFKSKNIDIEKLLSFIKNLSTELSFSMGLGNCLQDAFLALRYAKSSGKNASVTFFEGNFEKLCY